MIRILMLLFLVSACVSPRIPTPQPYPIVQPQEPQEIAYVPPPRPVRPPMIKRPLIVIDPGHGGEDAGTKSLTKPFYQEKSLTLATSRMVRDFLKQMGYETQMTRNEDLFIPLSNRATIANDANSTLFVSVHYNSAPSAEAHGIEVFFYQSDENTARTKSSKNLAGLILDEVLQSTQAKSRGVKKGNFAVIRETTMPAVLVEGGFLTNQEELTKIKDPAYVKRLAYGIARGIDRYLTAESKAKS